MQVKQESIPVGCVPPSFLVAGGLPNSLPPPSPPMQTPARCTRLPWIQNPLYADLPEDRLPPTPVNRMTYTCKYITLPETSLRVVKIYGFRNQKNIVETTDLCIPGCAVQGRLGENDVNSTMLPHFRD